MDPRDIQKLADACGELARAFKKIRAVLLKKPKVPKIPVVVEEEPLEVRPFELTKCDMAQMLEQLPWGANFEEAFYAKLIGDRLRGDRNCNFWALQEGLWFPVSRRYIATIFRNMQNILQDAKERLESTKMGVLYTEQGETVTISPCKWKRRRFVIETELSEKKFKRILVDNHKEYGPMRKPRGLNKI